MRTEQGRVSVAIVLDEVVPDVQFVRVGVLPSAMPAMATSTASTHINSLCHHDPDHTLIAALEQVRIKQHDDCTCDVVWIPEIVIWMSANTLTQPRVTGVTGVTFPPIQCSRLGVGSASAAHTHLLRAALSLSETHYLP